MCVPRSDDGFLPENDGPLLTLALSGSDGLSPRLPLSCDGPSLTSQLPDSAWRCPDSTHLFTERAQQIIEAHDPSQRLFLYQAYQAVHSPREVPPSYLEQYADMAEPRKTFAGMLSCLVSHSPATLFLPGFRAAFWESQAFS